MKNFILKLANYAFIVGLLMSLIGLWQIYQQRNLDSTPVDIQLEAVQLPQDEMVFASIKGGMLDISHTYELTRTTKKGKIQLSSDFYTPVVNPREDTVVYILQTNNAPEITEMMKDADFTGLLQTADSLPDKIISAYQADLPGQQYLYLDATYQPRTLMQKLESNLVFFLLMFGGLAVRLWLSRPASPRASSPEPTQATRPPETAAPDQMAASAQATEPSQTSGIDAQKPM
ncbi:hypothetical protein [Shewanella sp. GXUN23E]|uniref:hypothetical protein n=1 Tax=Shewanella sp. GXUN23E TaxID=3422498 RepID=UPI003D7C4A35